MARLGSFAAPVDLPEHLRPWAQAGVEALFFPGGLPLPEVAPAAAADAPAAPVTEAATRAWPEPWATLARRARIRPRVIITYASLHEDVSGAADPGRRKLFQTVLAYLAWPPGTTLFWPVCMERSPEEAGFFAADVFAQGVAHFKITRIAAFGRKVQERCATLFPQQGHAAEVLVHALPAPEELARLLPHELHRTLSPLKSLAFE